MLLRGWKLLGALAGVTVLYFVAGRLGLLLAGTNPAVTLVWPPAGIAVAALLLLGVRAWPAVMLGAFLVSVTTLHALVPALMVCCGNTLESLAAAVMAQRFARGRYAFVRGQEVLRFFIVAIAASTIGATIGTTAVRVTSPGADNLSLVWLTWWLGDATGIELFTPLCLLWATRQPTPRGGRLEAFALTGSFLGAMGFVLGNPFPAMQELPSGFLMMPLLIWAAFRFGARATSVATALLSVVAVYRTLHRLGPLALANPVVSPLVMQGVIGLFALLMLAMAAEITFREQVENRMRLLADSLERRVADRTAELSRVHGRLLEAQAVAHVGSWEWDVKTNTLWWSDEMCRVFGLDGPPKSYEEYLLRLHPDDRERTDREVREAASARRPFSFDHRIIRPDGQVRILHARGRVEFDAGGQPIRLLGIGHDITERKQAEDEAALLIREQAARREAEAANDAKDAFLATLSHELRTPLNAALGWAHVLREASQLDDRSTRAVQAICRNLLVQARLVSDILDVSRITRDGLSVETHNVELRPVVEAALEMVREAAAAKQMVVELRADGGDSTIPGDSRRLQQVAWNLLSNAVKFTPARGRIVVSLAAREDEITFTVEDDGPGIAPEFLPHVFEQFRQADSSVTRTHGGLGLGLAIAHHIVTLHHGTIEASNRTEGGARFVVSLPRRSAAADSAAGREALL
jgi:PAS domain S-box-containing protein